MRLLPFDRCCFKFAKKVKKICQFWILNSVLGWHGLICQVMLVYLAESTSNVVGHEKILIEKNLKLKQTNGVCSTDNHVHVFGNDFQTLQMDHPMSCLCHSYCIYTVVFFPCYYVIDSG